MFKKVFKFIKEVRVELSKVTWPKKEEILSSTLVVIVSTVILGLFLGFSDFLLSKGIEPTLSGTPTLWSYITLILFGGMLAWVYKMIQS